MTHIEQLHLDAINNAKFKASYSPIPQISESIAVSKSAEITENIAIEFAEWLDNNSDEPQFHLVQWTYKSMFQEYLKTKENKTITL